MVKNYELYLMNGNKVWIDLVRGDGVPYDAISIHTHNPQGTTFDSGVITIKKANSKTGLPAAVASAATITAPGVKELVLTDYDRAAYLVLDVTTASTGTVLLNVAVSLKKFGFPIA